jgi:hypothetical protein
VTGEISIFNHGWARMGTDKTTIRKRRSDRPEN